MRCQALRRDHRLKRLSTVVQGPYSTTQSRQRRSVCRTWTIPLMTRLSSTRRAPGCILGNCGSSTDQAASLRQNALRMNLVR